jgi:hypothetical protein
MKGDFSRWTFRPEKHYHSVLKQQGRVDLDSDWNEAQAIATHRVETETIDVIGVCGAPIGNTGFVVSGGKELTISQGRAYVNGLSCVNDRDNLPLTAQPDLPGFKLPAAAGQYVAYLKVWLRHITVLEDGAIREDALGGPDTCTRSKVVWQVNLLQPGKLANLECNTPFPEWDALTAASTGTLAARAEPDPSSSDPCLIPAKAGYRRLENQLYRVEIHDAGNAPGSATYKWSRDNGSVLTSWTAQDNLTLTVSSTGRDSVLGFGAGQWIELIDDTRELNNQPGTLARIASVSDNNIVIDKASATGSYAIGDYPANPRIRRWDSAGRLAVKENAWLGLEDGVEVRFSAGSYATGDYWLIPARTFKADVEWPEDSGGNPIPKSPLGIVARYCKLAIVLFDGSAWTVVKKCLPLFPPLTAVAPVASTMPGIHVTDVRTLGHNLPLPNDSDQPLAMLADGIAVQCDSPVAPMCVSRATCKVSVEIPMLGTDGTKGAQAVLGYNTLTLAGAASLSADQRVIQWKVANPGILQFLQNAINQLKGTGDDPRLLVRLQLAGRFIWGPENSAPRLYLDGEAVGVPRQDTGGSLRTSLKLPSGDGGRGGPFESWFWLAASVGIASVTFSPAQVTTGQPSTGTVILTNAAPANGAVVTLAASNPNLGTVPPSITIAAGATSGTFQVTKTNTTSATGQNQLQVVATYEDSKAQAALMIVPRAPA